MFGKRTLIPVVAATSIGLPYLASVSGVKDQMTGMFASPASEQSVANRSSAAKDFSYSSNTQVSATSAVGGTPAAGGAAKPLVGPSMTLDELFRFDITTDWVLRNWPRVSTVTNQPLLKGYRVPVVSGVRKQDIAGALTYYFNAEQKLQRIEFRGTTGEPRPLVYLLQRKYQFQRMAIAEAGVEIYRSNFNGQAISELRVSPSAVVRSDMPHNRFRVEVLIDHPRHVPVGEDGGRRMRGFRL